MSTWDECRILLLNELVKRLLDLLLQQSDCAATADKAAYTVFRLACRRINKQDMIVYPHLIETLVYVMQTKGTSKYSSQLARSALVALCLLQEDNSIMQDFAVLETGNVLQFWKSILLLWTLRSAQQIKRFYDTPIKCLPVEVTHLLLDFFH